MCVNESVCVGFCNCVCVSVCVRVCVYACMRVSCVWHLCACRFHEHARVCA